MIESDPIICKDFEAFKKLQVVFLRDMHMQGVKVTFKKVPGGYLCPETGRRWSILSESWKTFQHGDT